MTHRVVLPLLAALLLVAGTPATASAARSSHPAGAAPQTTLAAFGRGFRPSYRPSYRPAYRTRPGYRRPAFRPHIGRSFFRGVLHALGIAYLVHLLFGWGAGGSPFGLLLLLALVLLVATRRRRRPVRSRTQFPY
jgi:MYXO-CTERM domain-containing protein